MSEALYRHKRVFTALDRRRISLDPQRLAGIADASGQELTVVWPIVSSRGVTREYQPVSMGIPLTGVCCSSSARTGG